MDIFRDDDHEFRLRGRHPTVFPVQLPPWLPHDVLLNMISRFQYFLLDQIYIMMSPRVMHYRTPSQQSQSAISTGTHLKDDRKPTKGDPLGY